MNAADLESGSVRDPEGLRRAIPSIPEVDNCPPTEPDENHSLNHEPPRISVDSANVRHSFDRQRSMPCGSRPPEHYIAQHEQALGENLRTRFLGDVFMTFPQQGGQDPPGSGKRQSGKHLVISLAALQRMRLAKLRSLLANRVMAMSFGDEEPRDWEALLKDYTSAVKDYDFILSCVERKNDPFILTSWRELEARILRFELAGVPQELRRAQGKGWDVIDFPEPKSDDAADRFVLSKQNRLKSFLERLGMAIFGGIFLIGPMWLMVLNGDHYVALISTSCFVLAFAVTMAVVLQRESMVAVMSATAAYAAVLVVFVGTTTSPQ